jgi:hypothetical protein
MSEPLHRFVDLPLDIQREVARSWARAAQDLVDTDHEPSESALIYAWECLRTEPEAKFTADGREV